jgi:UDPglucose--hexose-1-phosphate uridylyltransferase
MAPARSRRPHDVGRADAAAGCPFCPGNEDQTPPETMAARGPDGGWLVRAFPNLFPSLDPAEGIHEVIVNTPRHVTTLGELDDDEGARAVAGWAARLAAVAADPRGLWPFLFLNQGAAAGASLQHTHAQVVGLPFAPPRLARREDAMADTAGCAVCADIARAGERLVLADEGLVAWCPEVPPLSGTVRIAPLDHLPDWRAGVAPDALGRLLPACARAAATALGRDDLNLWLHERHPGGSARFHWHLDLLPRVGTLAGLELGAGVMTIVVAPEAAAARMRAALGLRED